MPVYDQPNNESFCIKIEHIQYSATLAITGAVKGTSHTKLCKELGLKSLRFRRCFRQLCTILKIKSCAKLQYLLNLISVCQHSYNTQSLDQGETYYCRTETFKNSFVLGVEQT